MEYICLNCNIKFYANKNRKFCSHRCYWDSLNGRVLSDEHRKKLSRKGDKHPMFGKHHSIEAREKMSLHSHHKCSHFKGVAKTEEHKEKLRLANIGKRASTYTRELLSKMRMGEKNVNWKGGVTPINEKIRKSDDYKMWRKAVFERDNYTCVLCGKCKSGEIEADHIKPFSLFPELRFVIDNGRTLCKVCHKDYGWSLFRNANPRTGKKLVDDLTTGKFIALK